MNNNAIPVNDELLVIKGKEGLVNMSQWQNTGKYWARGTNTKSRTTSARGTHKVFKSKAKEIRKAQLKQQKEMLKAEMNSLQGQLAATGFIRNPSERLRIRNANGSFSYATQLRTGLSHNQLSTIEKKYRNENALNAELSAMMGVLDVGGKRKTLRSTRRRRHTKRKTHRGTCRR